MSDKRHTLICQIQRELTCYCNQAVPAPTVPVAALDALLDVRHEDDGSWSVSIRAMPGHVGAAMTLEQAFIEANDAAEAWVAVLRASAPGDDG